jgi:hypothetical protein
MFFGNITGCELKIGVKDSLYARIIEYEILKTHCCNSSVLEWHYTAI